MPRHSLQLLAVSLAVVVLASACSRLTFVKPNAQRKGTDYVAPEYTFEETEASKRRSEARRHASLTVRRMQAGDIEAAADEARAALKADPGLPEAHTAMAMVAIRQGQGELAGRHYAEAAKLGPSGATYNNYGAWLCGNGRAEESLQWFDDTLRDPRYGDRAGALANAGACADMAGQHDRAERDLRAALELDPTNLVALGAMAEHAFAQGQYLDARAFSQRRLDAGPATPPVLQLASRIEQKLGDSVAATRYVQRLRTEFPQAGNAIPGEISTP